MKDDYKQFDGLLRTIRQFFYSENFTEIYPRVLNSSVPLEPTVYPFSLKWDTTVGVEQLFLATSPERALKHALAGGVGNCFAIGKSFRTIEAPSDTHAPEFFMLEWYRKGAIWTDIMEDVEKLVTACCEGKTELDYQEKSIHCGLPWKRVSLIRLFREFAGCDLERLCDDSEMIRVCKSKGYKVDGASWEQLFNQIFLNEIEPEIGDDPVFLIDFPARISPLCAPQEKSELFAQRFELYIGGMEIGNGNTESCDAIAIRRTFERERTLRLGKNMEAPIIDEDFLESLDVMKRASYTGVGIGIERLAMILWNRKTIGEINP